MQLTKNNYEEYAIDWLDGNLKGEELRQMELFLSENPDILAELQGLDLTAIPQETIIYTKKDGLYRKKSVLGLPILALLLFTIIISFSALLIFGNKTKVSEQQKEVQFAENQDNNQKIEKNTTKKEEKIKRESENSNISTSDSKPQQQAALNTTVNSTVQQNKVKQSDINDSNQIPFPRSVKENKTSETDSLKQLLDSLQQVQGLPKIEWSSQPMAHINHQNLKIDYTVNDYTSKILIEAMLLESKTNQKQELVVRKVKGIKTPLGTIKFKEIREALLPESYFAALK
jgi:cell division protein FtsB